MLAEAGPVGLSIAEIARRIQRSGLRDLRTSKTPEARTPRLAWARPGGAASRRAPGQEQAGRRAGVALVEP